MAVGMVGRTILIYPTPLQYCEIIFHVTTDDFDGDDGHHDDATTNNSFDEHGSIVCTMNILFYTNLYCQDFLASSASGDDWVATHVQMIQYHIEQ